MIIVALAALLSHVLGSICFAQKPEGALLTLNGHTDVVRSVAFSPDGKRLASASSDGTVKLWHAETGKEIFTFKGHKAERDINDVWSVAFSPDGAWIASASYDFTVKLWDPATGKVSITLKHPSLVYGMAVSPDGQRVATGSQDRRVRVWDVATGEKLLMLDGHTIGVVSVAFSPDGKRLASGASDDKTVNLWDVATGERELLTLKHGNGGWSLSFSPDGKRLASSGYYSPVTVWNAATGKELLTIKGDSFSCVTFCPDGQLIAAGGFCTDEDSGLITLWDSVTGKSLRRLTANKSAIRSLAFSPDGKRLSSGSENGTIELWDVSGGRK